MIHTRHKYYSVSNSVLRVSKYFVGSRPDCFSPSNHTPNQKLDSVQTGHCPH